jgi:F-type H+-transporting ATPase subunit epsilon
VIKKEEEEFFLFISGGFLEVRPDKVIILADACEQCEEINIDRAEEARRRAEELLKSPAPGMDHTKAEAALRRSLARLKVAQRVRRKPPRKM